MGESLVGDVSFGCVSPGEQAKRGSLVLTLRSTYELAIYVSKIAQIAWSLLVFFFLRR